MGSGLPYSMVKVCGFDGHGLGIHAGDVNTGGKYLQFVQENLQVTLPTP